MEELKITKEISAVDPIVIAGWPGMGSVALGVVDFLKKQLGASEFATISVDPIVSLDSVMVEEGIADFPSAPRFAFYYSKNPELIIFEGEAQLPGQTGISLLNKVLDVSLKYKAKRIYTGAAFPLPVSHTESPQIYGAVNDKRLLPLLKKYAISPMEGGHISGLNGLLLGFAKARQIEAICLLATMPQYAISLPNPKASSSIIQLLGTILDVKLDMQQLDEEIRDMDEKMAIIEDKVKDVMTIEKEEPESAPTEKKIPGYIMEKIEKLFGEARHNKAKALELKKELDRWDLYKLYEDRFLDLFRGTQ